VGRTITITVLVLIGGYVVGAVAWVFLSEWWAEYGKTIKVRWPRWLILLLPPFFAVYVAVLKAITMRQLRKAAEEYDAAHPMPAMRATLWPKPTVANGRASVPTSRVIDGEWVQRR
jgi:hypothetical protein